MKNFFKNSLDGFLVFKIENFFLKNFQFSLFLGSHSFLLADFRVFQN